MTVMNCYMLWVCKQYNIIFFVVNAISPVILTFIYRYYCFNYKLQLNYLFTFVELIVRMFVPVI